MDKVEITSDDKRISTMSMLTGIIACSVIILGLQQLRGILIPFTFAVLLTFLMHPVYIYLLKKKLPKAVALLILLIVLFIALYLFIVLLISSVQAISSRSMFYGQRIAILADSLLKPFNYSTAELLSRLNLQNSDGLTEMAKTVFSTGILQSAVSSFSTLLTDLFIILLFWSFMIPGKPGFDARLREAFVAHGNTIADAFKAIDQQVQIYIGVKTLTALCMGTVNTIILLIFGIDFAVLWGLLTVMMHFVPNIGGMAATFIPMIFALIQYGFSPVLILLLVLLFGTQFFFGNFIEPKYLGKHLDLSPVVVLLALFFWGWIWGIPGMFLSVPLTSVLKIGFTQIPALRPLAVLMGGKRKE